MAELITTYDRAVNRLLKAALAEAERELGGEPTDWDVTFEGPDNVVVRASRGERFGTFAGRLDPVGRTIRAESYGTRRRFSRD